MKEFFSKSTKRCGIVVESDSVPLEGGRFHRFAQKIGTASLTEIGSLFNQLAISDRAFNFG
jgi:hypothetical protein